MSFRLSVPDFSERVLTSHEVGNLLQVDPSSVISWIDAGRLQGFRTPGGHRRVKIGDLLQFLEVQKIPVPVALTHRETTRILVVDDNARVLESLKRGFKRFEGRVQLTTATNGIDALILVGSVNPHSLVIDLFMPEVNGFEVCQRLKRSPSTRGIDVIAITGSLTPEIEAKALSMGVRVCLEKPLSMQRLARALHLEERAGL